MLNGCVELNKATAIVDGQRAVVLAPVMLIQDGAALDQKCWVATDGNVLAVVNEWPSVYHAVWDDCKTAVVDDAVWPYQNIVETLDGTDFGCAADPLFNCAAMAVVLFEMAVNDPSAWCDLIRP